MIAFPGERVNLHIFEPRYRQLINEIHVSGGYFGIPPVIDGQVMEVGTIMELQEIARTYPDGRMDIRCFGQDPFRMQDIMRPCPGKLYDCARAERLPVRFTGDQSKNNRIIEMLEAFYAAMDIRKKLPPSESKGLSYLVGHRIGLKPQDEYFLLLETLETKRQDLIINHLETFIPTAMQQVEIRKRAQLNGQFRKIDSL